MIETAATAEPCNLGPEMAENVLFYGDNLDVLRRHVKDETADLVYLDPPFNSNASYNVLFAEHGTESAAQIAAFEDTWRWDEAAAAAFHETISAGGDVAQALVAFEQLLGHSDMLAYLSMMAPRLVELHRVLKPTGSLYLHCDPTASHYLKLLLDSIFGPTNFRNEIVWQRSSAHNDARQGSRHYGRVTDSLLFYGRSDSNTFHQQYEPYDQTYIDRDYRRVDPDGRRYRLSDLSGPGGAAKGNPEFEVMGVTRHWRYSQEKMDALISQGRIVQTRPGAVPQYKRYLDEMPGRPVQNLWADVPVINNRSKEKLGYPTQKPEGLLERVILTSSAEGDIVLDPFCGCGTAVTVAQRLGRRWIGIDVTHLAIGLIKHRLKDAHGIEPPKDYRVVGEPTDIGGAQQLAADDPYQFQWWALGLVGARPVEGKKGADQGVDGRIYFNDEGPSGRTKQVILSVKAGKTGPTHIRDLRGVVEREKAAIGVLLTMQAPTGPMRSEAASGGVYSSPWGDFPRIQILSIPELLGDPPATIKSPPLGQVGATFKRAPRAQRDEGEALSFDV